MVELHEIDEEELIDEEIESEGEGISEPFDPTLIKVDTRTLTVDLLLSRIKYAELDLAPDFQRHAGIWSNDTKSRLIESIWLRIPLPAFYIDATDDEKWLVIDGLQRLTALKQFLIDKTLRLTGLQYLVELDGCNYAELPRKYQRRLLEAQLTIYAIDKGTPPEVKYNIFRRINTGGVPLTAQEIRHALNQGKSTELLKKLAKLEEFKSLVPLGSSRVARMEDREFVLGFLAYTVYDYRGKAKSRDELFHRTLATINKMSDREVEELTEKFQRAMQAAGAIFGDNAFRKISYKNRSKRFPVNEALFEAWSSSLVKLTDSELQLLDRRKDSLIDKFSYLVDNDRDFLKSISQASEKVALRFSTIEKLIQEVLQ